MAAGFRSRRHDGGTPDAQRVHHRRRLGRRLSLVLHRQAPARSRAQPDRAAPRRRRLPGELAPVPAQPRPACRRSGSQALPRGQVRRAGARRRDLRPGARGRRERRHSVRLRAHPAPAEHARRAPADRLGAAAAGRRRVGRGAVPRVLHRRALPRRSRGAGGDRRRGGLRRRRGAGDARRRRGCRRGALDGRAGARTGRHRRAVLHFRQSLRGLRGAGARGTGRGDRRGAGAPRQARLDLAQRPPGAPGAKMRCWRGRSSRAGRRRAAVTTVAATPNPDERRTPDGLAVDRHVDRHHRAQVHRLVPHRVGEPVVGRARVAGQPRRRTVRAGRDHLRAPARRRQAPLRPRQGRVLRERRRGRPDPRRGGRDHLVGGAAPARAAAAREPRPGPRRRVPRRGDELRHLAHDAQGGEAARQHHHRGRRQAPSLRRVDVGRRDRRPHRRDVASRSGRSSTR